MTWGMMLARLAFMSRPYKDGLGLLVTRSKMPTRSLRMQKSPAGETMLCAAGHQMVVTDHGEREVRRAGRANGGGAGSNFAGLPEEGNPSAASHRATSLPEHAPTRTGRRSRRQDRERPRQDPIFEWG